MAKELNSDVSERPSFEAAVDVLVEAMNRVTDYVPLSLYDEVIKPLERAVATIIEQRDLRADALVKRAESLRKATAASRASYVPGTPEKYPGAEVRGLKILEAEALLSALDKEHDA